MNKRAESDHIPFEELIFIVLNIMFFTALVIFIWRAGSGALVAEELYAKQIALMLDSMDKNMNLTLNASKLEDIAKRNNIRFSDIIKLDSDRHLITIKISEGKGYVYHYYSDFDNLEAYLNENEKTITFKT